MKCISKPFQMSSEKFILHSYRIWTLYNTFTVPETHKCKQHKTRTTDTFWTYKTYTYLFFVYFVDVVNRNRVSGGNRIKWNYLNKSIPVNYANLKVFIFNSVFTFYKSFFNCFNSIARQLQLNCKTFSIFLWQIIFKEKNLIFQNRNARKVFTV